MAGSCWAGMRPLLCYITNFPPPDSSFNQKLCLNFVYKDYCKLLSVALCVTLNSQVNFQLSDPLGNAGSAPEDTVKGL